MKYKLTTQSKKLLADTLTPVNIYLKLRDVFAGSILLESSDYHGHENSLSFICCDPIASFQVRDEMIEMKFPDHTITKIKIDSRDQVLSSLDQFRLSFDADQSQQKYASAGLFGYMVYDAVRYFEDVNLEISERLVPDILYKVYRYVIIVDHFSNELTLFEHTPEVENDSDGKKDGLEKLEKIIYSNRFSTFPFESTKKETSNVTDEEFLQMIGEGRKHCFRGDVFQIVLSRRFVTEFKGDEFNVYRALRSINPSPYLFYFDYGSFKIFGSSPEAQIQIKGGVANIFPIAGTFRRSGNDKEDSELAARLSKDEKENAEHVMLVDLARNDLARDSDEVTVEVFKEIQYYSHVIHLVSKVSGTLRRGKSPLKLAADTFPAGTLSGAPKHQAMTLINKYENINRSFYGGAIGFLGFNGDFNHAIMIRTFLSKDNKLICQAGAGVVAKSIPASELQEVNNKLEALRRAITMAEGI
ncbi:MAG: anthranilate synthase component I family protein [Cyclobacteriaceae bacterium]|nr:anthranilate synthase component I family protein [Cyclobacteriaceae bacterium]